MSLKKEPSGRRWIEVETEVPGTPEEVWQAIATGPGVSSWFVPTEMQEDGTVVSHFGPGMDSVATRTAWDPPHRFAAESALGPDAPKMATEWSVEARSGGVCVVRVVHSLFASTDDWDNQLESVEAGWPTFFQVLRLYLQHFKGRPCAGIHLLNMTMQPALTAWNTLAEPLGLTEANAGLRPSAPASGVPTLAGVVENVGEAEGGRQVVLRLNAPTAGIALLQTIACGGMSMACVSLYLYGDDAAATAAREESTWQAWMNAQFPPPTEMSPADPAEG